MKGLRSTVWAALREIDSGGSLPGLVTMEGQYHPVSPGLQD